MLRERNSLSRKLSVKVFDEFLLTLSLLVVLKCLNFPTVYTQASSLNLWSWYICTKVRGKKSMHVRLQSVIHRQKSFMCIGIKTPSLVHNLHTLNCLGKYWRVDTYDDEKKIQYIMFCLWYATLMQIVTYEHSAL